MFNGRTECHKGTDCAQPGHRTPLKLQSDLTKLSFKNTALETTDSLSKRQTLLPSSRATLQNFLLKKTNFYDLQMGDQTLFQQITLSSSITMP